MSANPTTAQTKIDLDMEQFLTRVGAKERTKIEKHLLACDAEPGPEHGRLWRRIALLLSSLAPTALQSVGQHAWRFFVPDGKYRLQVFALEDSFDGALRIYVPDVLAEALKAKLLSKTDLPNEYGVRGSRKPLSVEAMDPDASPAEHFKHMLGWNRKALRVTLPTTESDGPLVNAAIELCTMAALRWASALNPPQ